MCGFVGFSNCESKEVLQRATDIITHRGPDDTGLQWFDVPNSGLGFRRLSIIDLSEKGHQPMFDEISGNWIVFNGEIYNFMEIRHVLQSKGYSFQSNSDTEVVLKSYREWGKKSLEKLNGMFSYVIMNEKSSNVFGARDRLGIKPFYYFREGDHLMVSSEIKSILECKSYRREPDYESLVTPVHYQAAPRTGFKNIFKLPAGHSLEFFNGELKIEPYWDIQPEENDFDLEAATDHLDTMLKDSVKLQLVSDVPVGLLLSGGLDSSLIGAYMAALKKEKINSFTIRFGEEDRRMHGNVDDSFYARKVAERFGFEHTEINIKPDIIDLLPKMIWHLDEPVADPSVINTYLICKAARERGIIVLMTGMGGDEVYGGYRSYLACLKGENYRNLPGFMKSGISRMLQVLPASRNGRDIKYIRWAKKFIEVADLPPLDRYIAISSASVFNERLNDLFAIPAKFQDTLYYKKQKQLFDSNSLSYLNKMCYNDTHVYMTDHNLHYSDKGSMAASVELRPPLIDHRIVEFMFTLKEKARIHHNEQKFLLKRVAKRYISDEIINRPKAPFSVPLRSWIKKDLKEMVDDLLSETSLKRRGIYNPDFVNRLVADDRKGLQDNAQLIFRIMVTELWFRTFFDNKTI